MTIVYGLFPMDQIRFVKQPLNRIIHRYRGMRVNFSINYWKNKHKNIFNLCTMYANWKIKPSCISRNLIFPSYIIIGLAGGGEGMFIAQLFKANLLKKIRSVIFIVWVLGKVEKNQKKTVKNARCNTCFLILFSRAF